MTDNVRLSLRSTNATEDLFAYNQVRVTCQAECTVCGQERIATVSVDVEDDYVFVPVKRSVDNPIEVLTTIIDQVMALTRQQARLMHPGCAS